MSNYCVLPQAVAVCLPQPQKFPNGFPAWLIIPTPVVERFGFGKQAVSTAKIADAAEISDVSPVINVYACPATYPSTSTCAKTAVRHNVNENSLQSHSFKVTSTAALLNYEELELL